MTLDEHRKHLQRFEVDRLLKLLALEADKQFDGQYSIFHTSRGYLVIFGLPPAGYDIALDTYPYYPSLKEAIIAELVLERSFRFFATRQQGMQQETLHRLIEEFLWTVDLVFDGDWDFTQLNLEDRESLAYYIQPDHGTFLHPRVIDESNNWGNRGHLLAAYRALCTHLHWQTGGEGFYYSRAAHEVTP